LKLPEDLQVKLLAPKREHFLGSVPAFAIPGMLLLVWSVIIVALVLVPWRRWVQWRTIARLGGLR